MAEQRLALTAAQLRSLRALTDAAEVARRVHAAYVTAIIEGAGIDARTAQQVVDWAAGELVVRVPDAGGH
jgi:hypothetical protein